jgi:hypothetical protein
MGYIKGLLYWGYVTANGKIEVKRYISDNNIANYERMSDVVGIFEPFEAFDIHEASRRIHATYAEEKKSNDG